MVTISGPAQQNDQSLASERHTPVNVDRHRSCSILGLIALSSVLLACGTHPLSASPSVALSPDRRALLVTSTNQALPAQMTLQSLPTESTIAPGLFFHPQRFDQIRLSPDGQYAAFSTVDHHSLVGLLDVATMAVREIDVVTEGDVVAFHWAADGRTLVYDYIPANGYRWVKGYDLESGEHLVVSRIVRNSPMHVMFESWGPRSHEVILGVTDKRSNERRTETVTLIPHK